MSSQRLTDDAVTKSCKKNCVYALFVRLYFFTTNKNSVFSCRYIYKIFSKTTFLSLSIIGRMYIWKMFLVKIYL